jgi:signal transduction histidine kinase
MTASPIRTMTGANSIRGQLPVLLLAAAVLLPTACVLWLIKDAVRNQRQVVGQKLTDAYLSQLSLTRERLDTEWSAKPADLDATPGNASGFARLVKSGAADSAVILDPAGTPVYPALARLPEVDIAQAQLEWVRARQLEKTDWVAAASAYIALQRTAKDPNIAARAIQAAARCFVQAGQPQSGAGLLVEHFGRPGQIPAISPQGRSVAASGLLMAIRLLKPSDPRRLRAARRMHDLLMDYDNPGITSAQRIFLMKEMRALDLPPELARFPTLEAEELGIQLLEAEPRPLRDTTTLRTTRLPGVWAIASPKKRVVALFRTETILTQIHASLAKQKLPAEIRIEVLPPGDKRRLNPLVPAVQASELMPSWQLALVSTGPDPFKQLEDRQLSLYLWIGILITGAVAVFALIAGRLISRSLKLAGLKADLMAVVSHELKTPLTSMRLLVDTLLDDPVLEQKKTREYLDLIASENARLSLLIENFLTFSRMERSKYSLEFADVRVEDVVTAAVKASGQRFYEPGCHLEVEVTPGLPDIRADHGALVAALVNLLDNAYKYTPSEKQIALRSFSAGKQICFEVRDNGIGIPAGETKKIFRKFYQTDQRLSRSGGGCGLGLSIVHFLVEAHGGSVQVASEVGKGSTFTVALEAAV